LLPEIYTALTYLQVYLGPMRPCLRHIVGYEDLAMGMSAIHLSRKVGITHLQLRSCDSLDADALSLLLGSLQSLRSLDFACCSSLDDKALAAIARHEASSDGPESLQRSLDDISLAPQKVGCLKSSATCSRSTRGVLDWLPCLVAPHPLHALEKGVLARHSTLGACARNVSAGTIDA
jgi:hypothetical protein